VTPSGALSWQFLADGLVAGATIGIGAIGVTLTYSILRFANFAHGEFMSIGCYLSLAIAGACGMWLPASRESLGDFSVSWGLIAAALLAVPLTGLLALGLDALLFRPLRTRGTAISAVIASFGASLALRALLELIFSSRPRYFTVDLQIALPLAWGVRATPDQLALVGLAAIVVVALHLLVTRTGAGRAMRAVSENPTLARVVGIDVAQVIRLTWVLGAGLAAIAGVLLGLVVQIRPSMGAELLLPLFAAAILGGVGSIPGALVGGLIVGIAEAATVQFAGAEWRAAVAFLVLIGVLLVRPTGLFGRRE
jgi:branched-chain amino acid transport system permease protein